MVGNLQPLGDSSPQQGDRTTQETIHESRAKSEGARNHQVWYAERKTVDQTPAAVAGKELGNMLTQAITETKAGTGTKRVARKVPRILVNRSHIGTD